MYLVYYDYLSICLFLRRNTYIIALSLPCSWRMLFYCTGVQLSDIYYLAEPKYHWKLPIMRKRILCVINAGELLHKVYMTLTAAEYLPACSRA